MAVQKLVLLIPILLIAEAMAAKNPKKTSGENHITLPSRELPENDDDTTHVIYEGNVQTGSGDRCSMNVEDRIICSTCTKLIKDIRMETCCSEKSYFVACEGVILSKMIKNSIRDQEVRLYVGDLADERYKRYGNLFSNRGWSNAFGEGKANLVTDKEFSSEHTKDKGYNSADIFTYGSNKDKRYGSTFNQWNWDKLRKDSKYTNKRYGSTFNTWDWSKLGKRSNGLEKRYGSTFNKWGWNKLRGNSKPKGKSKRYGSTFNKWGWSKQGKFTDDIDKRYGSTFNRWNWEDFGKRSGDVAKRYGSTFNRWNWDKFGKRNIEAQKRYGNTFNSWNWDKLGKRDEASETYFSEPFYDDGSNIGKEKRYGITFSHWNWDKLGKRNDDINKRYGSTFNSWNWGKLGKRDYDIVLRRDDSVADPRVELNDNEDDVTYMRKAYDKMMGKMGG